MPEKKKSAKELLKENLLDLETGISAGASKEYNVATQEQLKELIEIALRQNKRIAERIDYLTQVLREAVTPEEEPNKLLLALGRSQVEALEELEGMKKKLSQLEKKLAEGQKKVAAERAKTLVEYEKALKEITEEQAKQLNELEKKIQVVNLHLALLPSGKDVAKLSEKLSDISEEIDILSDLTAEDPEKINARIAVLKQELDALKKETEEQEKKTREELLKGVLKSLKEYEEKTNSKIENLEKTTEKNLAEKINRIEKDLKSVEEKIEQDIELDSLQPEETAELIASIKQDLENLKKTTRTEALLKKISSMEEKVNALSSREQKFLKEVEKIEERDLQQEAMLKSIDSKVRELEKEVRDYEELVSAEPEQFQYAVARLKQDIDKLSDKINKVNAQADKTNELQARVALLSSKMDGMEKLVSEKVYENMLKMRAEEAEKIEEVLKEVNELKKMIQGIPREAFAPGSDADAVNKKISELEKRIEQVEHRPSKEALKKEVMTVKQGLEEDPARKVFQILSSMSKGEERTVSEITQESGLPESEVTRIIEQNPGFQIISDEGALGAIMGKKVKKL